MAGEVPKGRAESRLRGSGSFQRALKVGHRLEGALFLLVAAPNALGRLRLGLAVGRRLGGAVARNRVKRILREAFRHGGNGAGGGYDVVVIARPALKDASLVEVRNELVRRLARLERRPHRDPGARG